MTFRALPYRLVGRARKTYNHYPRCRPQREVEELLSERPRILVLDSADGKTAEVPEVLARGDVVHIRTFAEALVLLQSDSFDGLLVSTRDADICLRTCSLL